MAVTPQDREDYPYIIANSSFYGSFSYWTEDQIRMARECDAPRTTHRVEYPSMRVWDILDATPEFREKIKREMDFLGLPHPELD